MIFKSFKYKFKQYLSIKNIKREARFFHQRMTRGFDDSDTFSLDQSLAILIAPRLKRYKEVVLRNCPSQYDEEGIKELDMMIEAFEYAASDDMFGFDSDKNEMMQKGLDLFAKNYLSLWW